MKMMEYKGYIGTIEADFEQDMLFGKLAYIRDVVTYEAHTVADLQKAFEESVDKYLSSCAELHKKPDKPFKGSFNVRIGEELHRQASLAALSSGEKSLNAFVVEAIRERVMVVNKRVL